MNQIEICRLIAEVAHGAKGQMRADGVTRYAQHPSRVAVLALAFMGSRGGFVGEETISALCAAWLHDVVEDTKVTLADLRAWGVNARTIRLVDLLTKKNEQNEAETAEYYAAIAQDSTALLIKCADRAANLEDCISEVKRGNVKRWKNYVDRTYTDVLPLYTSLPELRAELETRLKAIEEAILEQQLGGPVGVFDCGEFAK